MLVFDLINTDPYILAMSLIAFVVAVTWWGIVRCNRRA